jgi:glucose-6-phosphate isomerase
VSSLTQSPAWQALAAQQRALAGVSLNDLFARDMGRSQEMVVEAGPLFLDYSRHRVTLETFALFRDLLEQQDFTAWRAKLFAGARLNDSEGRSALHTALRDKRSLGLQVDGVDAIAAVRDTLTRMHAFSAAVRDGTFKGVTGQRITDIVCVGIGGSDLGPRLICDALAPLKRDGPNLHFVANLDGADRGLTLAKLDPHSTLAIISSKTFTTMETIANAHAMHNWFASVLGLDHTASHLIAVTAHPEAAQTFGIPETQCFQYWDWVGGRFSVWSAVGLPIALGYGFETFDSLLDGAFAMDQHFHDAPLDANLPVIMAVLGVWYRNFFGTTTHAVFPYSHPLRILPDYLQQLEMESLGKTVDRQGHRIDYATAPVIWGGAGTSAQHSVFQWLHQGSDWAPADFIIPVECRLDEHQRMMMASLLGQAEGLLQGRAGSGDLLHAALTGFEGNRPSSVLVMDALDAYSIGALLAAYEHKVFTQSVIWNVNPFDQYGVELGKQLAKSWATALHNSSSVTPLMARLLAH